jgi:hypothetical protein
VTPLKRGIEIEIKKDENLKTIPTAAARAGGFPDGRSYDVQFARGAAVAE